MDDLTHDVFPTDKCALAPKEAVDEAALEASRAFVGRLFGHLPLKGVSNVRDLGGMPAADGRCIRSGRLIRSGLLHHATKDDLATLAALPLDYVVDLRTDVEVSNDPDPAKELLPAHWEHLSVLSSSAVGITDDEELSSLLKNFSAYHDDASAQSIRFYPQILLDGHSIELWRRFFELLLANERGALLWHCTAGKDRTGLAAFLIEIALGVPQDLIMEDYLASNEFTQPLAEQLIHSLRHKVLAPKTVEMIHVLYSVEASYLEAAVAGVLLRYGTLDAYLEQALGLDDSKVARLRGMYLA